MALTPGTRLGPYVLQALVGAGGMGEVYRAEDSRLRRTVAIKILPRDAATPERIERFEREARAASALNHPNILTVHDIGREGATAYIAMEWVEGRTLRELLRAGPVPVRTALPLAQQIADGLAKAHGAGIVHRDLKPENVMVTEDGLAKIVDFGLAASTAAIAAPTDDDLTRTHAVVTEPGMLIGTIGYLSPEQASGRAADYRADQFALGLLLYELLTGIRPFQRSTAAQSLAATIEADPPSVESLNTDVPPHLAAIVTRLLAKAPAERYDSTRDLARELRSISETSSNTSGATVAVPRHSRSVRAGIVTAVVLTVVLAAAWLWSRRDSSSVTADLGAPSFTRATSGPGLESWPALSPDGRWLAYAGNDQGEWDIFVKGTGDEAARNLTAGTPGDDTMPAFSPDGRLIAFRSSRDKGGIFVMTMAGESVRRLVSGGYDPAWSPDGTEIFYAAESGGDPDARFAPSQLWAVNVETEQTRMIAPADAVAPRVSPDGRLVAYWGLPVDPSGRGFAGGNRDIWIRPVAGGDAVRLTDAEGIDWNPVWAPEGTSLYFSSDRSGTVNLWRIAVDPVTGAPSSDPQPVTTPALWAGFTSVSRDGATLAYAAYDFTTRVESIGFDPVTGAVEGEAQTHVAGTRAWQQPDISPDGTLLALRSARAQEDIYLVNRDGTGLRALTSDPALDRTPRWWPDGQSLVFYSTRSGRYQFWSVNPDGSGLRQLTHTPGITFNYPVPSRDGRWLGGSNPNTREQFILDRRDGTRAPERLPAPPSSASAIYLNDWSPDGTRIAAHESPTGGIWMYHLADRKWERIVTNGAYPRWLPDGQRLVATSRGRIVLVDARLKDSRDLYEQPGRRISYVAVSQDGRRLYFTSGKTDADVWLMRFQRPKP